MAYNQTFGGATTYPAQVTYIEINASAAQQYQLQWPIDNNTLSNSSTPGASLIFANIMDVNCTANGAILLLPDTAIGSFGAETLINNVGTQPLQVASFQNLSAVVTLQPAQQYILYYGQFTGGWQAFQLGSTTTAANASALAGAGLKAISNTLNQSIPVVGSNTNNYTFGSGDLAKFYAWIGGSGTWNLPASATMGSGYYVQVRNAGSGALSLTPNGTETINGGTSALVFNPGDSAFVATDGAGNWYTVGFGNASNTNFQFLLISLAGLSGTYTISGSALNKISYRFSGALAGNIQVVVPATVAQYWVDNETTGGTFSIGVSGQAAPVSVSTAQRVITYCDGTNVVNADTGGISTPVAIAQGGTGATTAGGALSNLGGGSTGIALFQAATITSAQTTINTMDASKEILSYVTD